MQFLTEDQFQYLKQILTEDQFQYLNPKQILTEDEFQYLDPKQILTDDQFQYFFDWGTIVVAVVDSASLQAQPGDTVRLGRYGEEGTYTVRGLLPLQRVVAPRLDQPVAVILSVPEVEPWGLPFLPDPRQN